MKTRILIDSELNLGKFYAVAVRKRKLIPIAASSHRRFRNNSPSNFGTPRRNLDIRVVRHTTPAPESNWVSKICARWTYSDPLRANYNTKMVGINADISKPKGSKKLKDWESR